MIRTLIIDDEPMAYRTLKNLLSLYCPEVSIVGKAEDLATGIEQIQKESAELVFLDIHLKDGSGFDLLDQLSKWDFQIIFTTAYDEFALKAFKYNAIDYLLKPIAPQELKKAVGRVQQNVLPMQKITQQLSSLLGNIKKRTFESLLLSTQEGLYILPLNKIIRLESSGNYTSFFTTEKEKIVIAKGIKEYDNLLPSPPFFRIHQSHIINLRQIKKLMKEDGGYVVSSDNAKLPIARRKKDHLLKQLKMYSIS